MNRLRSRRNSIFLIGGLGGLCTICVMLLVVGARTATSVPAGVSFAPTRLPTSQGETAAAVVREIPLFGFTPEDAAFVGSSLEWLEQVSPEWWHYLAAQRPFRIYLRPDIRQRYNALGVGRCCTANGDSSAYGEIEIGEHPTELLSYNVRGSAVAEIRRYRLLSLLIHEATHVRDERANRFRGRNIPAELRACVLHESSSEVEMAFARKMLAIPVNADETVQAAYRDSVTGYLRVLGLAQVSRRNECGVYYKRSDSLPLP